MWWPSLRVRILVRRKRRGRYYFGDLRGTIRNAGSKKSEGNRHNKETVPVPKSPWQFSDMTTRAYQNHKRSG